QADGSAVHEDELLRGRYRAQATQVGVHALGDLAAIDAGLGILDPALLVFEQRAVYEMRPAIEDVDHLFREAIEAPALIGVDREIAVAVEECEIKIDHAL